MENKANITKKYRPLKFSEVVGQDTSVKILANAIQSGVIPPAYLFYGTRGCGKTTSARLVAMSLNCRNRQGVDPCGQCPACRAILDGSSEHLVEVDSATFGKVEETRQLMASMRYVVADDCYRVVIMDECHGLTKQAWDASLKPIEEPPPRVLFIFCTTEIQKVIPTIKSRCTVVPFAGVADNVIADILRKIVQAEGATCDDAALAKIVRAAGGSIRDAQTILEGFVRSKHITEADVAAIYQSVDPQTVMAYFNAVIAKDTHAACNTASGWTRAGITPSVIITGLLEHLRNMIMDWKITDSTLRQMVKLQRDKIGDARVATWIDFFYDQLEYIRDYPMEYTLVTDLITIKLIETLRVRDAAPKKKKDEEPKTDEPKTPIEAAATPAPPPAPARLNIEAINRLVIAIGGTIQHSHSSFTMMTLHYGQGQRLDVVTDVALVASDTYFMASDIDKAIENYPKNMRRYAHYKGVQPLDPIKVQAAVSVLGGAVVDQGNYYATIKVREDLTLDIVATAHAGVSKYYLLEPELAQALADFPTNINNYLKTK